MNVIPKELDLLILNYLDLVDFGKIVSLLREFNILLTQNDYLALMVARFPQYYKKNIMKYDIEYLYLSLLSLPVCVHDDNLIYGINTTLLIKKEKRNTSISLFIHYELYKYLLLEDFTNTIGYHDDSIFIYDDLDTFIIRENYHREKANITWSNTIKFNSMKILNYMLTNKLYPARDLGDIIVEIYEKETEINQEIIRILADKLNLSHKFIILLVTDQQETVDFLLDQLDPSKLDSNNIDIIINVYKSLTVQSRIKSQKFVLIWRVYSKYFKDEDIIEFYKSVLQPEKHTEETISIITYLAHQLVVENKYLIWKWS